MPTLEIIFQPGTTVSEVEHALRLIGAKIVCRPDPRPVQRRSNIVPLVPRQPAQQRAS